ncbi:MAG: hypothetical protein IKD01_06230 [Oscillospiraceae bacterium]|nr:hypothetical protein [Oscillospiraceae bacterium]MBR7150593.1 hypothetical protein [Oscillospiraceae bacterium]
MNRNVILVAETGSDLTPQMANKIGAYLVPMHVSMGGETYDDGACGQPPHAPPLH